jgi:hypothetical protein
MTKILFAIRPKLLRDALCAQLAALGEVQVVGEVDNDLDLLLAVRATKANVVLHSWRDDAMPALYTHLLQEYPGLVAIGVAPDGTLRKCEQRIVQTPLDGIDALLASLRVDRQERISA